PRRAPRQTCPTPHKWRSATQEGLPFKIRRLDSDCDSEFLNRALTGYCAEQNNTFTRGPPTLADPQVRRCDFPCCAARGSRAGPCGPADPWSCGVPGGGVGEATANAASLTAAPRRQESAPADAPPRDPRHLGRCAARQMWSSYPA